MTIVGNFNSIIVKINSIICSIRNVKVYLGTTSDPSSANTISGRLLAVEESLGSSGINIFDGNGKIKCEYINLNCIPQSGGSSGDSWSGNTEWLGSEEWEPEDSTDNGNHSEW